MTMKVVDVEALKARIAECEERYHKSFKMDSCREIMDSYRERQLAKKTYYAAIGLVKQPVDPMSIPDDSDDDENCGDFNSLI